ncbi:MAG: EAL domain-containing protein [Candidatus Lustribacter sp.]|jgi:diguanylate cyclase (GGDEF)-like protein
MALRKPRIGERRLESVLSITRDILRAPDLDFALESIARGVAEVFGFQFVTIVIAEDDSDVMLRRVMYGYAPETVLERKNEEISRADMIALLDRRFESAENCFYLPAEAEADWEHSIYSGTLPRDAPRSAPEAWHERDSLCLVLRDEQGTMIGYLSPDAPLDGCIPDPDELRAMELFVNLMGLALAKARAQTRLRREATHDALTGLANRSFFQEQLELALVQTRNAPDRASAVLFFDLDDFKQINDTLGHLAGDAMLRVVADRLQRAVRGSDVVGRIGGDEFGVLLNDRADAAAVDATVARIQETLVAPASLDGRIVYITASVGITLLEEGDERIEDVLARADAAMYHAKALGHARYAYFEQYMLNETTRRLALSSSLRTAVEGDQFSVEFQPIVQLADGSIAGFEALVRWRTPSGEVLPAEFVPIAEEVGLIVPIGRFVLAEATRALRTWRRQTGRTSLRMHVNLSVGELLEPDIEAYIVGQLRRFELPPDAITIEMTESAMMRGNTLAFGRLAQLRARGIPLCIDDFGTGYSSLRYVRDFSVDALKIDRSFVESPDGSLGSTPIVRMLIQLGAAYALDVVAEGVETAAQAAALQALDCRYAQGFHFYRPMSASAISRLLRDRAAATS